MIDYGRAREIARRYLADNESGSLNLVLLDDQTLEEDFGWVFFYQSESYVRSGNFEHQLAGNAPVIVSRADGSLHETGTAYPVKFYIENFRQSGSPHR